MQPWLYIVILGAGIIGYAIMRPRDVETKQTAVVKDIEIALDQFAEELEEGNKDIMNSVSGLKRDLEAEINKLTGRLSALEKHNSLINHASEKRVELFNMINNHQDEEPIIEEQIKEIPKSRSKKKPVDPINTAIEQVTMEATGAEVKSHENDIKNRYGTIFELHAQGKSVEYIAKKSGKNKGEIQLIIQLARQEEQFRA